ncbi:Glucose-repressible protein [Pseudocyphellaria aurata]|nr:Glucose-repressible protein [Pseudocyphellaria aurata]
MDTIKNAVNQASESFQGTGAGAKKEGNKELAKDSNLSISDRATAAKDAAGNKLDESKHNTKSEAYKNA